MYNVLQKKVGSKMALLKEIRQDYEWKQYEVAKKLGLKTVATNDCHYENKEDWEAHDIHVCIATNKTLSDPHRMKMSHELGFFTPFHTLF